MHGRPDGAARRARRGTGRGGASRLLDHGAEVGHVVDRDHHLDLERLAHAGVDHGDGPGSPHAVVAGRRASEEAGDLVQRALRGGEADPLGRGAAAIDHPVLEALEGDREVAAPLGGGQRMDLVDDHGLDAAQRLAGGRGEHQVERLGGGDEDVGRVAHEGAPLVGGRVPGADADRRLGVGLAQPLGGEAGPLQRGSQVLLHVDGQGPQGRHVDDPRAVGPLGGSRRAGQHVDAPQERRQRLARAGGRQDQRVLAAGDGRPPLGLRGGGLGERGAEPGPHGRRERLERIRRDHGSRLPTPPDTACQ